MKKIEIDRISNCRQCPFVVKGRVIIQEIEPPVTFLYCGQKAYVEHCSSAFEVIVALSKAALDDFGAIPDWCPLPDSDRSEPAKFEQ